MKAMNGNVDTKLFSSLGKKEWEDWVIIWHLILFEDVYGIQDKSRQEDRYSLRAGNPRQE